MRQTNEVIPISDAIEVTIEAAKEHGLESKQEQFLELLPLSCTILPVGGEQFILLKDFESFIKNVCQAIKFRDSSFLRQRRGTCVSRVVGVEEFTCAKEFMNQKANVRPAVLEGLIELFDSERSDAYIEAVLTGSIGWGKTYFACIAIAYMVYKLSCFHSPQVEYDLAPGTSIVFILQSKKEMLAKKVVFENFGGMLQESDYFKDVFPWDPHVRSELRFPKGIHVLPLGGSDTSAIGMNVFGGVIDELNFMSIIRESEKFVAAKIEDTVYDQAERLYTAVIRRMKTRFIQKGTLPGKLMLISSVNYPGDFTSRKIKEAKKDKTILAIDHALWDVLPADRMSAGRFYVEVGNDRKQPRILENKEDAVDQEDVIEVPTDFKPEFERDLITALKDYAGRTTGSTHPFIPYKELIAKAQDDFIKMSGGKTLFRQQEIIISRAVDPTAPDWEEIVDMEYVHECIADRATVFALHIDASTSEDATGLAIGRIYGYKMLPSMKYFDPKTKDFVEVRDIRAPVYMIDGVLRIVPPPDGSQIDYELIRSLVMWFRGCINLKWGTMDSYQSAMMIQSFRKAGIRSGVLSVDTSMAPYTELKLSIKDERILFPPHDVLARELREVEKDREKDVVDHPSSGSKDVSDAVAGVVYMLQMKEASYGRPVRASQRVLPENEEVRSVSIHRKVIGAIGNREIPVLRRKERL